MDAFDKQSMERGQRVGVAVADYAAETTGFAPLETALSTVRQLTTALEGREGAQNADTQAETQGKDAWREVVARKADTLSKQARPWGMVKGDVKLRLKLTLSYTDLRYGEADEDMDAARELVAQVRAIPAADRTTFRISADLATEVETAVSKFEQAEKDQLSAQQDVQLATLSIPELGRRLRAALELARLLITGQKDVSERWAELATKFAAANKTRKLPGATTPKPTTRVVKKLAVTRTDGTAFQLDDQNYGPLYELKVENLGPTDLRLWMGLEPGGAAQGAPGVCPAGLKRTFRRTELGPETARRLMAQFAGETGGEAKISIRRVVSAS